jgi:hypothetical protein
MIASTPGYEDRRDFFVTIRLVGNCHAQQFTIRLAIWKFVAKILVNAASSDGRCNTFQCTDSAVLLGKR